MKNHTEFKSLSGVVSGRLFFTPSRMSGSGDNKIPCRVVFHIHSSVVPSTRINGRFLNIFEQPSKRFRIVVYGKLAEACCVGLSQGRMVDIGYRLPRLFPLPLNGLTEAAIVANNVIFGEETPRQIHSEIEHGIRPKHWNCTDHDDYVFWSMVIESRESIKLDLRKNMFGFAYIVKSKKVRSI